MSDEWPFGPDPVTLAAGDEDLEVEPFPADAEGYAFFADEALEWAEACTALNWAQARPFQEDGELETLDWWRRHPDGKA